VLSALHLASRTCYEELADLFANEFGLVRRGLLMLCKEERTLEHEGELVEQAMALGVDARILSSRQTAELDPAIKMDIAGSVYFASDCHLNPGNFVAMLTRELISGGAELCWNSEVTGWSTSGDGKVDAVRTVQGERSADEYVLAAGSWSPSAAQNLKLDIPLQAGKGYSITIPNPKQVPQVCSLLMEARVAVTPMGGSLRFGGTMEITGLDKTINPRRVQGILKAIPRYFPEFSGEDYTDLPVWRGLRPCSPDGLPYIGRSSRHANLCVATAHAMMGLSLAPITGKIINSILCGDKPSIDIQMLRVDRFANL
jgi:D-amino-acid dehydrogenase